MNSDFLMFLINCSLLFAACFLVYYLARISCKYACLAVRSLRSMFGMKSERSRGEGREKRTADNPPNPGGAEDIPSHRYSRKSGKGDSIRISVDLTGSTVQDSAGEEGCLVIQQEDLFPRSSEFSPLQEKISKAREEISKQVFGMESMTDQCFIALLSGGHVLCEGLPGLAKTTLAKAFSQAVSCRFKRCQFSPDLLPSDLIGDRIFNQKTGDFDFKQGPVFTQILLADEINRAPAKTQAALLEVMQEAQVTVFGEQHLIGAVEGQDIQQQRDRIFFTIATQNPIVQEGTYRLPEAQLDRFMFRLFFHWPSREAELAILNLENGLVPKPICSCFTSAEIVEWRGKIARDVKTPAGIQGQIVDLIRSTREHKDILVGAGPRACQVLLRGAKAKAAMDGRDTVNSSDVQAVAFDALNHRLVLKPDVIFDNPDSSPLEILRSVINDSLASLQRRHE